MKYLMIVGFLFLFYTNSSFSEKINSASGDPDDLFFQKEIKSMDNEYRSQATSTPQSQKNDSKKSKYDSETSSNNVASNKTDTSEYDQVGIASWYGKQFQGKTTSSGEKFDKNSLTGAHPYYPLGSTIEVKNLDNNKSIQIKINDRGPFVKGRILDVSEKSAELLDFKEKGTAKVGLKLIDKGEVSQKPESNSLATTEKDTEVDDEADLMGLDQDEESADKTPVSVSSAIAATHKNNVIAKEIPNGFSVQVGVFRVHDNAKNLKKLLSSEIKEKIYLFERDETLVVQIGDFKSRDLAENLQSKLRENGVDCFIPKKETSNQ